MVFSSTAYGFWILWYGLSRLKSYLSDRSQSGFIGGVCSSPVPLSCGVPQGSVLGPTLYTMYISPVHDIVHRFGVLDHYFDDDSQFYKRFRLSISNAEQRLAFSSLSSSICEVKSWFSSKSLRMKDAKTPFRLSLVAPTSIQLSQLAS